MDRDRKRKLIDIGSTTALSAMVEIAERKSDGVLARQARAMLDRLPGIDRASALEGFCDELQALFESIPSVKAQQDRAARAGR